VSVLKELLLLMENNYGKGNLNQFCGRWVSRSTVLNRKGTVLILLRPVAGTKWPVPLAGRVFLVIGWSAGPRRLRALGSNYIKNERGPGSMYNFKLKKISVGSVFKFSLITGMLLGFILGLLMGIVATFIPQESGMAFGGGIVGGILLGLLYGLLIAVVNAIYTFVFNFNSAIKTE